MSDAWHCPCLFSLGAAGDVVPISRYGESRRRIGTALGLAAILAERTFSTEVEPQLSAEAAECDAQVYDGAGDGRPNWKACESQASSSSLLAFLFAVLTAPCVCADPGGKFTVRPQHLRIGTQSMAALPFEVLSESSLRMKEADPCSMLISCAGGYEGECSNGRLGL